VTGCCECGSEPSGSIKCGEFLGWFAVTRTNGRSVGTLQTEMLFKKCGTLDIKLFSLIFHL